ncbi:MAG: sigma-70 family RNA polymerase sigma factor [Thermoguttaceae bacterium]|nr:sigma-70 family RNA polymerase sigma factor [Thermoguttaceae bacterium]
MEHISPGRNDCQNGNSPVLTNSPDESQGISEHNAVHETETPLSNQTLTPEEASAVFMRHIGFVRTVAEKNAPSKLLVEDVVHDTLIHFLKNASSWRYSEAEILGLLKSITLNMANRHWREYIKYLPQNMRRISEHLLLEGTRRDESDDENRQSRILALRVCIQKLSPENRSLVEMLYYDEMGYREACRMTGRSRQAIYMQMSRIRSALSDCVRKVTELEVHGD